MSIKDWFLEDSSSVCSIPLCRTCQYLKQYDAGGTQEQEGKLGWEERKDSGEVGGRGKKVCTIGLQIKTQSLGDSSVGGALAMQM